MWDGNCHARLDSTTVEDDPHWSAGTARYSRWDKTWESLCPYISCEQIDSMLAEDGVCKTARKYGPCSGCFYCSRMFCTMCRHLDRTNAFSFAHGGCGGFKRDRVASHARRSIRKSRAQLRERMNADLRKALMFSVMLNESTDKGGKKNLAVYVRNPEKGRSVTKFWTVLEVERGDGRAEKLLRMLVENTLLLCSVAGRSSMKCTATDTPNHGPGPGSTGRFPGSSGRGPGNGGGDGGLE